MVFESIRNRQTNIPTNIGQEFYHSRDIFIIIFLIHHLLFNNYWMLNRHWSFCLFLVKSIKESTSTTVLEFYIALAYYRSLMHIQYSRASNPWNIFIWLISCQSWHCSKKLYHVKYYFLKKKSFFSHTFVEKPMISSAYSWSPFVCLVSITHINNIVSLQLMCVGAIHKLV